MPTGTETNVAEPIFGSLSRLLINSANSRKQPGRREVMEEKEKLHIIYISVLM